MQHDAESVTRMYLGKVNEALAAEGKPLQEFDRLPQYEQQAHLGAAQAVIDVLAPEPEPEPETAPEPTPETFKPKRRR